MRLGLIQRCMANMRFERDTPTAGLAACFRLERPMADNAKNLVPTGLSRFQKPVPTHAREDEDLAGGVLPRQGGRARAPLMEHPEMTTVVPGMEDDVLLISKYNGGSVDPVPMPRGDW